MEKSDMRRTRLNFGELDWTNLLEMAAVGILLAGGFPVRSMGQQQGQKTFSSPENAINALVTAAQNNDEEALLDVLGPDGKQIVSSGDETEDARTALISCKDTKKCIVSLKSRMELLFCTSARRIGRRLYPSSTKVVRGISTPMQARKRFCLDELAGIKYRPFVFASSSWRRKRNITPQSPPSMPRKSSVMKGSTMVSIGRLLRANPRALSGRWWRQPLLRATPKTVMALRLRTAATTTTS